MKIYKVLKSFPSSDGRFDNKEGSIYSLAKSDSLTENLIKLGYIEEIQEKPKTVWDLEDGDKYYCITSDGLITTERYLQDMLYDDMRVSIGNAFLTYKEAEKEVARRKARVILEQDTKGFKADWKNGVWGFIVYWDGSDMKLDYGWEPYLDGTIRFQSAGDAKHSIKKHEKEWRILLGVEEEE